ncbi:MAG: Imm42 family immunity protein [Polyangiaceae bacterium]
MISVGIPERFGIEAEVTEVSGTWIFGHFRFRLCGKSIGDWDDTTDLGGCVRWLKDFAENPRERFEPSLIGLSAADVFRRVYDPVMARTASRSPPPIRGAYARFHVSHLGMSSFERFDVLLIKDARGGERCLWRSANDAEIFECRLWRNEMETVASEFCERFAAALPPS